MNTDTRSSPADAPPRTRLAEGLEISRVLTGLWQVADLERGGTALDIGAAVEHLDAYARAGFDTFDMADHYGSAELIAGDLIARRRERGERLPLVLTKWCPAPGPMTADVVAAGVEERLTRLRLERLDLLQFHWWSFEHPAWLDALHALDALREAGKVAHIGVTNFDADHLELAIADGVSIASNQVSFSLLDRRAAGRMSEVCERHGIRLLAYGTLCGGLLGERWAGRTEPRDENTWSEMKYRRFIETAGGWEAFQSLLEACGTVAARHGVSIANVASRWVLDHPAVAAIIVGARLGEREHRADNLGAFSFALDTDDRVVLDAAFETLAEIPGDCGDEYRRPPYLTASGDLSDHLDSIPSVLVTEPIPGRPERLRVSSGSVWEPLAGFSRAVRVGERVLVSGTTATHGASTCVAPDDAGAQALYILDKITASLRALGADIADVVRTRVYLKDIDDWQAVSRAHGRVFGDVRPANTLLQAGDLVGDYKVEIEVEAIVGTGEPALPRSPLSFPTP